MYQDNVVIALHKAKDEWLVTAPFHAPARQSRVALLLDSNNQTARSYMPEELKTSTNNNFSNSFLDPIELRVNGNLFLLGDIEPVSQLRYVSANNKVYLQADHIVPLLQSPRSTFTDLEIVKSAESVELQLHTGQINTSDNGSNSTTFLSAEQLSHWNDLNALMIIDADLLDRTSTAVAIVSLPAGDTRHLDIFPFQQHVALRPATSAFAYLISEQQAEKLGICVYC